MPEACSAQETSAFLRTKLTHRYMTRRLWVNIVTVTRNSRQEQEYTGLCLIIHCACSTERVGGGGSHSEGKLRDGGVLMASMTPALQ